MIGSIDLPFWVYIGYVLLGLVELVAIYIVGYWVAVFFMDFTKTEEAIAKVWPFGEWDVVFIREDGENQRWIPSRKEKTVDYYFKYIKSEIIKDVWIVKVGGFLDGIRIKPRPRKRNSKG